MLRNPDKNQSKMRRLIGVAAHLFDPGVGVIGAVAEVPREAGGPDFFHFLARSSDASAFNAFKNFSFAGGAAVSRDAAIAKAMGEAVERYCSAFFDLEALPLCPSSEAAFEHVSPREFACYSFEQYSSPGFPWVPFTENTP